MVAHYWPDISNGSYGLIRYTNNSNSWISTYIKISDIAGEITINGISAGYRPQRGVLVSGSWTWDTYVLNADINNNTSRRMVTGSVIDGANFHQIRLQAEPIIGGYQLSAYDNDTGSKIGSVSIT